MGNLTYDDADKPICVVKHDGVEVARFYKNSPNALSYYTEALRRFKRMEFEYIEDDGSILILR